jgi:hypothetical protein
MPKLSALPAADTITGAELVAVVQGGVTKKAPASALGVLLSTGPITVTSAQLKDLVANPVEIIPAPGVGKAIFPTAVYYDYKFGTVAYVDPNDGRAALKMGGVSIDQPITAISLIDASESKAFFGGALIFSGPDVSLTRAQATSALVLGAAAQNLTTGDGTLTITVLYQVVDLS